jgi:hypothetical protein
MFFCSAGYHANLAVAAAMTTTQAMTADATALLEHSTCWLCLDPHVAYCVQAALQQRLCTPCCVCMQGILFCCNCCPAGQLEDAEVALREVLGFDLPLSDKLPVLAQLADVQLKEDSVETEAKVAAKLAEAIKQAGGDSSKVCWLDAQQCLVHHAVLLLC